MEVGDLMQARSPALLDNQSIHTLSFFLDHVCMLHVSGVPHQGGLPGQLVPILNVKAVEWGSPPNRDNQITAPKPAKTHGRTSWLPAASSVAGYFDDFTSKTAKMLMKLTLLATI